MEFCRTGDFEEIKYIVANNIFSEYSDFNNCFDIHTYESGYQIFTVIFT